MRHARATARAFVLVVTLAAGALSQGCILEWVDYFTKIATLGSVNDEHRVRDLRVLGVQAEPPELRYDLAAFEEQPSAPIDVEVEAFAYDPRGGDVEVTLQVCARALDPFGGGFDVGVSPSICLGDEAAALAPQTRVVTAEAASTGGRLPGLTYSLPFDAAAIRALSAIVNQHQPTVRGFHVVLALTVTRDWLGQRETEQAILPLPVQPEIGPTARQDLVEAALEREEAELCSDESPRDCVDRSLVPDWGPVPATAPGSVCGDNALEPPEQCDPPADGFCNDDCTVMNLCERDCAFITEPNTRPQVYGLVPASEEEIFGFSELRSSETDIATLHDGDVVTLSPGDALDLAVVVAEGSSESYMPQYPGALQVEYLQVRWYVFGNDSALTEPSYEGAFTGQGYAGAVRYQSSAENHSAGQREPLVVLVSDERGGMTVTTLQLVFE